MRGSGNSRGQISIFLAVIMVIIVGLMAFIINIGIFVKAKINLQNAVDAAAYSGAAVQARQLSNIAYMNWEMRNIYKEWMFKYYVIGQLSLAAAQNPSANANDKMDFRLPPLFNATKSNTFDIDIYKARDPWNIPSVCINFQKSFNICNTYTLPGLPRFTSLGSPGADEINRIFVTTMGSNKSRDCAVRSSLNFLVANEWAYGLGTNSSLSPPRGVPTIAIDRPGVFPRALEAAIRVRNLERIVNEPPKSGVTLQSMQQLQQSGTRAPIHERTVKAFWAGYRNLAKSPDEEPNNLKGTFTLTEIAPRPKSIAGSDETSLSAYLIVGPPGGDFNRSKKHYLDLQLQLVNFATFFHLFTAHSDEGVNNNSSAIGLCGVRKMAIPVPGHPLGFIKNPDILTYYAVRGEASFTGLFNPFADDIKMVAYAAAKPFGGRIGPHLFKIEGDKILRPRANLSFNYLTGLDLSSVNNLSLTEQRKLPIPPDPSFWLTGGGGDVVGGIPQSLNSAIKFAIPNMPFDFVAEGPNGFTSSSIGTGVGQLSFQATAPYSGAEETRETAGLYSAHQFFHFRPGLLPVGQAVDSSHVKDAITEALRPTAYEAANYLIPTLEAHHEEQNFFSIGPIPSSQESGGQRPYPYRIYAPLFGEGLLFSGLQDLEDIVARYFDRNKPAIDVYLNSLKQVAITMARSDVVSDEENYSAAAKVFHHRVTSLIEKGGTPGTNHYDDTCDSIAGKFGHLYFGSAGLNGNLPNADCPRYLKESLIRYWNDRWGGDLSYQHFFTAEYVRPNEVTEGGTGIARYMTGYLPGARHGADEEGRSETSFRLVGGPRGSGRNQRHRRNRYSVKFISLKSLVNSGGGGVSYGQGLPLAAEGLGAGVPADSLNTHFLNPVGGSEFDDVDH